MAPKCSSSSSSLCDNDEEAAHLPKYELDVSTTAMHDDDKASCATSHTNFSHERYMTKIESQQQELERLRDTCDRQTRQICQLTMQITAYKTENDTNSSDTLFYENQALDSTLKKQDDIIRALYQRIEEESLTAREAYDARCQLHLAQQQIAVQTAISQKLEDELNEVRKSRNSYRETMGLLREDLDEQNHRFRSSEQKCKSLMQELVSYKKRSSNSTRPQPSSNSPKHTQPWDPQHGIVLKPPQTPSTQLKDRIEELERSTETSQRNLKAEITDIQQLLRRERELRIKAETEGQRLMSQILDLQERPKNVNPLDDEEVNIVTQSVQSGPYASHAATDKLQLQSEIRRLQDRETDYERRLSERMDIINHLLKKYGLAEDTFRAPDNRLNRKQGSWSGIFGIGASFDRRMTDAEANRIIEETQLENIRLKTDMALLAASVPSNYSDSNEQELQMNHSTPGGRNREVVLFDAQSN